MASYTVTRDTSNHPLAVPVSIKLNQDVIDRISRERIVLGVNTIGNRSSVQIIMIGGHHAPSGTRGLSNLILGKPRKRRTKSAIAADPLNYMRSAYGTTKSSTTTTTTSKRPTTKRGRKDSGKVTVEYNGTKIIGSKEKVAKHVQNMIKYG